jgi:hypothetical protein
MGLLITHKIGDANRFSNSFALHLLQNPNGIQSQSPGLRVPRYPGKWSRIINPNGVVSSCSNPTANPTLLVRAILLHDFLITQRRLSGRNPFGVEMLNRSFPRVARYAQPWALGLNPVGILKRQDLFPPRFYSLNIVGNE